MSVNREPELTDRTLMGDDSFALASSGVKTFHRWYTVPLRRGDVVVFVEHRPYGGERMFGRSVAFLIGHVDDPFCYDKPWVVSLLPLPGIVGRSDRLRWGYACAECPPEAAPLLAYNDQADALMAAVDAGLAVTVRGLLCQLCRERAGNVKVARMGYEIREGAAVTPGGVAAAEEPS